jgi:hypothetical protein
MTGEDLHKGRRRRIIAVRLALNGFAALILHNVGPVSAPGPHGTLTADNSTMFVVRSFLACSAERFVPDQLGALEPQARNA